MACSYEAEIDSAPAAWARVQVADGVPVTFILVDPERAMETPVEDLRYAFILDVATREDRRGEGHFRHIMEHTFESLRGAGVGLLVTHGRYQLYRRFGFDVFTHHSGIFITPVQIERALGPGPAGIEQLSVEDRSAVQEDLLLVTEARAATLAEARAALQTAAVLARERGKARILFEHPPAPSYGSRYPIYASLETPLTALARSCGGEIRVQGADPEGGSIPDADWIKVLDTATFLREALRGKEGQGLPRAAVAFETEAGAAAIVSDGRNVLVQDEVAAGDVQVKWPASALAQLVTGYRSAELLNTLNETGLPDDALALLAALFPSCWRLSRNESWTFSI
jgi:GNAT superfamily N-acetyltransferase